MKMNSKEIFQYKEMILILQLHSMSLQPDSSCRNKNHKLYKIHIEQIMVVKDKINAN